MSERRTVTLAGVESFFLILLVVTLLFIQVHIARVADRWLELHPSPTTQGAPK